MNKKYQPERFEKKWREYWDKNKIYKSQIQNSKVKSNSKFKGQKQYVLAMFPYPSGAGLHVGHVRVYTGTDVTARFFRMKGNPVLHPMGFDAFGLPAENAAVKAKKNPMDMVPEHIATFKKQMKSLGFSYDWDREFSTTDPSYYKWTQWLFIQFFKMGLLYKKNSPINYCPKCKTGLAEEEVLPNGTHERCGNKIEKRDLPQWVFKITDYADRLLADLHGLDWPEGILAMQRNWIGKKEGINISYDVVNSASQFLSHESLIRDNTIPGPLESEKIAKASSKKVATITCFTTRPDTNFGATFIVLAPEHEFVKKILRGDLKAEKTDVAKIKKYVENSTAKSEMERATEGKKKTGVFTGFYAINNLNGRKMPIWISDFVLMGFGTGAVVGVPGHDKRDFEFAKEFGIDVIRVVVGKDGDKSEITKKEQVQEEEGIMINSDFLDGMDIHEATKKIMDYMEEKGWGKKVSTYHLRDWIFSRQRYWGEPIPMIFCAECAKNQVQSSKFNPSTSSGLALSEAERVKVQNEMFGWFPIPESELPLKLPYVKSYEPTDTGESPLSAIPAYVNTKCPNCGGAAKRETDTMPNWAGSCWYFIRFAQTQNSKVKSQNLAEEWLASRSLGEGWLPVDRYLGGAEHAVLHLLYARFWVKALYDLKLLDFKEPFLKLSNVGMILAEDHRKMSKSWGNVINPDNVIAEYGADALRVYEMFMAPFNAEISWSTKSLQGSYRFVKRIWEIYSSAYGKSGGETSEVKEQSGKTSEVNVNGESKQLAAKLQKTIKKITQDIPQLKFNTSIAAMMGFLNDWEKALATNHQPLTTSHAKEFLQILAPFAPFITEEIWHEIFGEKESIHLSSWPEAGGEIIEEERVIPVQVNGKLRSVLKIKYQESRIRGVVEEKALKDEKVKKYVSGKPKKIIYIQGKIINIIT